MARENKDPWHYMKIGGNDIRIHEDELIKMLEHRGYQVGDKELAQKVLKDAQSLTIIVHELQKHIALLNAGEPKHIIESSENDIKEMMKRSESLNLAEGYIRTFFNFGKSRPMEQ